MLGDPADVAAALARVRERIAAAAARGGRRPGEVTLVAATKRVDVTHIRAALAAGVIHIGESRIQEAGPKIEVLGRDAACWHLIGHLQRNKVRQALALFDVIESVDSDRLASDLAQRATAPVEILVQVNVSGEPQKFGLPPEGIDAVIRRMAALPHLSLTGLMAIAPLTHEPDAARPVFRRLRELRDHLNSLGIPGLHLHHLSMGMTDDFDVAIEEGATIVRIGRALFGDDSHDSHNLHNSHN